MSGTAKSTITAVFERCALAIKHGELIRRKSRLDKEFHFQDWIGARLAETTFQHEVGGCNSYPDFRIVQFAEGYEVKG